MFKRTLKTTLAAAAVAAALSAHAQIAQDPLLSRTAPVEPNIVFMLDDSGSMPATAIYQFGGGPSGMGRRGPNNDPVTSPFTIWVSPPTSVYGRSPDVNLIYYDPRVTYSRRINADGSFQAPGSIAGLNAFDVYFFRPNSFNTYGVQNVTVTNGGANYSATGVTATFPAPPAGGTQATATVNMGTANGVSSVTVNNAGRNFNAGTTITFSAPPSGITATGTVNMVTSSQVQGVAVLTRGRDYPVGTTGTFSAPPAGGIQATGTPVLASTNKVGSVNYGGNIGSGYAAGTTITFSNPPTPGVTATGTPVITQTQRVATLSVTNPGTGYPAGGVTAVLTAPPLGTTATASVTTGLSQRVVNVSITNAGRGYPASPAVTFAPGAGTTATGTAITAQRYRVGPMTIASGGSYSGAFTTGTINFSAPAPGGVQATGTVTRTSGAARPITSINITNPGAGYASPPTILSITGLGTVNTPATFNNVSATDGFGIVGINMTGNGSGYASTPGVAVGGGGTGFSGTANMDGNRGITSITLTNPGTGYLVGSPPTITLVGAGAGAGAAFNMTMTAPTNSITGITLTNPGSGYTTAPTINYVGAGGGTGASWNPALVATNWITGVTMGNPGSGYTTAPTYTVTGPPGAGATFTVNMQSTLGIGSINITNGGSGYTTAPTINLVGAGAGTGFNYAVNLGTTNVISGFTITNAGSGYTTQPALTLGGVPPGAGAVYTVNYLTTSNQPANQRWTGVPLCGTTGGANCPITISSYFSPSYTPDSGSPLAPGATVLPYPNTASAGTAAYPKFKDRTDCVSVPNECTWAEEQQNHANWKTYHSTRLELSKTGIGLAFQPLNPTFRLGWGVINTLDNTTPTLDKGVGLYNSTVQSEFLTWLYSRTATGSTPNRKALNSVGQYFQRGDDAGPWAAVPDRNSTGVVSLGDVGTHAACRRSYAMLMTDGYYNDSFTGFGDFDTTPGTPITAPTNYTYSPIGPYSDTALGTKVSNTLADVAMKYWMTDLRSSIDNNVKPVAGDEAYWQHLNFYAIGLGLVGTLDANSSSVLQSLTGSGTSSPPRTLSWPTALADDPTSIDDMWHATVNGRGKMLNAKTASELNAAIALMMSDIAGKEGTQAGVAVSTASLTQDTKKYTPSYIPIQWNGNVTAFNLDATTANQTGIAWQIETLVSTDPISGKKTYSSIIPPHATRNIFVGTGNTSGTRALAFNHAAMLAGGLTAQMNGTVDANLINFLRGDATNEDTSASSASSAAIYRERTTRLGDIVNSTPVFVKGTLDMLYNTLPAGTPGQSTYAAYLVQKKARPEGVLFVGANDGMLHGFRDGTFNPTTGLIDQPGGIEVFAYVPNAILPTLNQLADKAYVHRYYVDGPNTEHDVYLASASRWANMVIGSTGGGAGVPSSAGVSPRTAIFAIDTTSLNTSVTSLDASSVMWEISSKQAAFSELGHVLTDVQTGVTLGGQWVAVFGNGYESKSCQARLFVVNAETGALIKEFNTGAGSCGASTRNGLGGVRVVRNDKQQIIGVYAGDLLGNVWKFNMSGAGAGSWAVDLSGVPLYAAGSSQPITAPPTVLTLPMRGTTTPATGFMVVFGTGKFFEVADITAPFPQQSIYGIWDPLAFGAGTIPAGTSLTDTSLLIQQTIGSATAGTDGNTYFQVSSNPIDYMGQTVPTVIEPRRGWWLDFPNSGQRLVYPIALLARRYVLADTISPSNVSLDPCSNTSGGTGYLYLIDALNGGGPNEAVFDTNGDGNVDSGDMVVSGLQSYADGRNVALEVSKTSLSELYADVSAAAGATFIRINCNLTNDCPVTPGAGGVKSRQWRQLFLR